MSAGRVRDHHAGQIPRVTAVLGFLGGSLFSVSFEDHPVELVGCVDVHVVRYGDLPRLAEVLNDEPEQRRRIPRGRVAPDEEGRLVRGREEDAEVGLQ